MHLHSTWMIRPRETPTEASRKIKHYSVQESVGIACGLLIAALHNMRLAFETYAESDGLLSQVFQRPANEKPAFLTASGGISGGRCGSPQHNKEAEWRIGRLSYQIT
jgi:hypothetical protein